MHHLGQVALVVVVALHAHPRAPLERLLARVDADAHHVRHLVDRHLLDPVEEMVEALRRLPHVDLLIRLHVYVPLDVGAHGRLDLKRLGRVHRVQVLLHQLNHQHLLVVRLALHQPQPWVAGRVRKLLEAALHLLLVVVEGVEGAGGALLVALPHLLLQFRVLLLAPPRIELPVLYLRLLLRNILGALVLLILILFVADEFVVLVVLLRARAER